MPINQNDLGGYEMSSDTYYEGVSVLFDNMLYKLDTQFLSNLFEYGVDPMQLHPERDELAWYFVRSGNYALQKAAAQSEGLSDDHVKKLIESRNYHVRLALAGNLDAVCKLRVDDLVWLGQCDIKIAQRLLQTLEKGDEKLYHQVSERLLADYEAGDVGLERDGRIAPCVRLQARCIMADNLYHKPQHSRPGFHGKFCTMRMKHPPAKNRAYLRCGYDHFVLDPEEVIEILDHLNDDQAVRKELYARHLTWLLQYPDLEVVEHVAEYGLLPAKDLEKFLNVGCHDVGMAALRNDNAVHLSDRAIINFIFGDASSLAELLDVCQPKHLDRFMALFEEDTRLKYVVDTYRRRSECFQCVDSNIDPDGSEVEDEESDASDFDDLFEDTDDDEDFGKDCVDKSEKKAILKRQEHDK